MKIFPIGTSRLHEPLRHLPADRILFPGMGYFHASSQVLDVLDIVMGRQTLPSDVARYFFRKDQTPQNPFDEGLWSATHEASLHRIRQQFDEADALLIEISSTRTYELCGLHVQGNPNVNRQVPYAQVWKEGYYARYEPEVPVRVGDDGSLMLGHLATLCDFLHRTDRRAVVVGHLVNPDRPNLQRRQHNAALAAATRALDDPRLRFHDPAHLVKRFDFRVLDDGTQDIHHLPEEALEPLASEWWTLAEWQATACS